MFWLKQIIDKKNLFFLFLLLVISIPSIYSLLQPGFFQSDDGEWMIIRFSAFHEALRDGQFPVRFLGRLNHGFGYPVVNFLYPGFMYFAEPIHLLGFNFVDSIKILLGLSMFGSLIFAYLWLAKIFYRVPAIIGALFYLYTPYHLFDLYKRGSAGEIFALMFVPFIFWQIERKSFFWLVIGIAFLILAHNTLALLFLPIILLYLFLREKVNLKSLIYKYISILVISFGLSSFFWIPAVFELSYTNFSNIQISNIEEYFASVGLVGLSSFIILFTSIIYFINKLKRKNIDAKLFVFFDVITALAIFFSSQISESFWNFIPASFIQFPFRLLSLLILSISFLSAYLIYNFEGWKKAVVSLAIIILLFYSAYPYLKPSEFFNKGDAFYSTNEGTTTVKDEYLPKWVKQKSFKRYKNKVEIIKGEGKIKNLIYNNSKKVEFDLQNKTQTAVRVNTVYYPGWQAYIDGRKTEINYTNDQGLIEITSSEGEHKVKVEFIETPLRLFADIISFLSFIFLLIISRKKVINI